MSSRIRRVQCSGFSVRVCHLIHTIRVQFFIPSWLSLVATFPYSIHMAFCICNIWSQKVILVVDLHWKDQPSAFYNRIPAWGWALWRNLNADSRSKEKPLKFYQDHLWSLICTSVSNVEIIIMEENGTVGMEIHCYRAGANNIIFGTAMIVIEICLQNACIPVFHC